MALRVMHRAPHAFGDLQGMNGHEFPRQAWGNFFLDSLVGPESACKAHENTDTDYIVTKDDDIFSQKAFARPF